MEHRLETGRTRSGARFRAIPVATPHTFQLGDLLEQAIHTETDGLCFDVDNITGRQLRGVAWSSEGLGSDAGGEGGHLGGSQGLEDGEIEGDAVGGAALESEGLTNCKRGDAAEGRQTYVDRFVPEFESPSRASSLGPTRVERYHKKRRSAWFQAHGQQTKQKLVKRYVGTSEKVEVDVELPQLPFTSCGYQGKACRDIDTNIYTLDELKDQGYTVIKHVDGISRPLVDSKTGKVFAVVVGTNEDPEYVESTKKAFEVLQECGETTYIEVDEESRRRNHPAIHYGVSYGRGVRCAHWLSCKHKKLMQSLLSNPHIVRLATFASCAFALWAPKVYSYYFEKLGMLYEKFQELRWPYYRTVWPCMTFNFGPNVCCKPHRDSLNLPFGWCAIQALGRFDHLLGGHLVLPDLRLAIEFPAGSLILIPSSLLIHANTPVRPWEKRISFTQFCSGGLFRFVDNGFQTEGGLKLNDKKKHAEMMAAKESRRDMGISLWSTIDELISNGSVALSPHTP